MACEARSVLSYGTELRGCAEGYIRCVLEPALEEELERGKKKKKKKKTKMKIVKIYNDVTIEL